MLGHPILSSEPHFILHRVIILAVLLFFSQIPSAATIVVTMLQLVLLHHSPVSADPKRGQRISLDDVLVVGMHLAGIALSQPLNSLILWARWPFRRRGQDRWGTDSGVQDAGADGGKAGVGFGPLQVLEGATGSKSTTEGG